MARWPQLFGAASCVEAENLASIRQVLGEDAGLSCSRAGAPGPWSKDTILFLDRKTIEPQYIVKAGTGKAVDLLLQNESNWIHALRQNASLTDHVPELVAHRVGADLSFVAQSPIQGKLERELGEPQFEFLRKFQNDSRQILRFKESRLYKNLCSRMIGLNGLLSEAWSNRLQNGLMRIEQLLSGEPILMVAAHNDFTLWNIRVDGGIARVFDWEYADIQQLPLFDPLHFTLMPMALGKRPVHKLILSMNKTMQLCRQQFGMETCYKAQAQALAYLLNLCTLYLYSEGGKSGPDTVLASYAKIIDSMLTIEHVPL
jgi:hypothetical protein